MFNSFAQPNKYHFVVGKIKLLNHGNKCLLHSSIYPVQIVTPVNKPIVIQTEEPKIEGEDNLTWLQRLKIKLMLRKAKV